MQRDLMNLTPEQIADIIVQKDTCVSYTDPECKERIESFKKDKAINFDDIISGDSDFLQKVLAKREEKQREKIEKYEKNVKEYVYSLEQAGFQLEAFGYKPREVTELMKSWEVAVNRTWKEMQESTLAKEVRIGSTIVPETRFSFVFDGAKNASGGVVAAVITQFDMAAKRHEPVPKMEELVSNARDRFIRELENVSEPENLDLA